MGMLAREIILAHPVTIASVSAVRSTLIQSSLATLRERGFYERYLRLLDRSYHDAIFDTLTPAWLPLDIAMAHYSACEALDLEHDELLRIGQAVGDRIQGSYIGVVARGAKLAGVTPWVLLNHLDRIWSRMFQGGAVAVTKVGPKDAIIDIQGVSLASFDYFRIAFSGLFIAGAKLASARTANVEPVYGRCGRDRLVYRAAWV
jgi:hypothetical protein